MGILLLQLRVSSFVFVLVVPSFSLSQSSMIVVVLTPWNSVFLVYLFVIIVLILIFQPGLHGLGEIPI